ncbi:EAL domain-containing protein [Marichromatium bheemlicum]|uniref:EAL domain-containing protein n=1 Tax=Marichromatium bheemlicum TaxID=365339 RepID=A0ABX1I4N1_9GAMM|nr:EAL domain-containing protein [Marichromatium bheemlicum]NKN32071.1 EAL domain-containing protein [Marichromatium bheemlicum]
MTQCPLSVLIVEDDPAHAEAVARALEDSACFSPPRIAQTLTEALQAIAAQPPDAVIADLNLADGKAYELLPGDQQEIRYPVLVMTSQGDEQMAVQAMKAGALDYVVKSPETFTQMPRLLERVLREYGHITERTRAQEALRASERRLTDIINFLPDATFAVDAEGRVIAWNLAVERMTGVTREQIIGTGDQAYALAFYGKRRALLVDLILAPEHHPTHPYDNLQQQEGDQLTAEVFNPHLDQGRGVYLRSVASPLRDPEGRVVGAIESVRDITEPKRAQQEILRAYGESRAITEAVHDTLYMVDLEGRLLWWNKRVEAETGYGPETLRQLPLEQLFVAADAPRLKPAIAAALSHGYCEIEGRTQTVNGIRSYRYNGVPVRDKQGEVIGIAGVGQDITERLHDQERLRLAAAVLDNTHEGIMITDAAGKRLVVVNQAFTEISGYSETEALEHPPSLLKSGRHDRQFYQAMWASILQTGHWQGEVWNRRRNGELFPAWLTISRVRNEHGATTNYVGIFSDISQVKQSEARLEHLAHYDALTDLPNRLLLLSRLEHAIHRAARNGRKVAVLFIDLDRFKNVNDSLGHPLGDELLQVVAERLHARCRTEDTLARLGGDEFVLVLESIERPDEAGNLAQQIIELMGEPFHLSGGRELYLGASIGISLYPDNGTDTTQLLRNADTVMYQAKSQGRNTYRYYTESLTRAANARLSLESRLRRALEREELVLHYQPQVDMRTSRVTGVEALVRWEDPDAGLIPPDRFIPLAEETGLIIPLGAWVLASACRQLQAWIEAGAPPLTLAVNLSSHQFAQPDLAMHIGHELQLTGLPPELLELELTESTLMQHDRRGMETLEALRALGIALSIDDFGTGYSSLAYLKQLPIDKLKIDKSFVQGIPEDRNDAEIAATIIAMARNLNLRVLAEGVETEAQRDFLRRAGCDAYQGYLFSRPLPGAAFARQYLR